jgi:hypothetical protein
LPPVLDLPYAALQPDYATGGNGRENDMLHLSVFVVALTASDSSRVWRSRRRRTDQ